MKSIKISIAIIFNIFVIIKNVNELSAFPQNYNLFPYLFHQIDNPIISIKFNEHNNYSDLLDSDHLQHDNIDDNYDFTLKNNDNYYDDVTYKNTVFSNQVIKTTTVPPPSLLLSRYYQKNVGLFNTVSRKSALLGHFLRSIGLRTTKIVTPPKESEINYENVQTNSKITTGGLDLEIPITSTIFDTFKDRTSTKAIYPGTVWCGGGDSSKSERDIGLFFLTDHCCKLHDKCPKSIPANSELFGLKNIGVFTRSHCSCDSTFYNCLKRTDSFISNKVGYTYFNLLSPQCFREEHPIIGCDKRFEKKCISYIIDETKNKTWQWFDNNHY